MWEIQCWMLSVNGNSGDSVSETSVVGPQSSVGGRKESTGKLLHRRGKLWSI